MAIQIISNSVGKSGLSQFFPSSLERGQRSEKALSLAVAEMYINGVSTRKVRKVMEKLCGLDVTSSQVSEAAKKLDHELEKWRSRPLGCVKAAIFDAMYEKVRLNGSVVSAAVLVATGIYEDGRRSVLGVSVAISEAEVHWRTFLTDLKSRGLHGLAITVSDDHPGLKAALTATFPGVRWQRCQTHLQRNASSYVTKQELRKPVATDLRNVFNAPDRIEANRLLEAAVKKWEKSQPKLASWMEENVPEGLSVLDLPESCRKRLRTSNMAEGLNRQIRRRTRVATLFPNEASLLRLVSAVLMEVSEEWEAGKVAISGFPNE